MNVMVHGAGAGPETVGEERARVGIDTRRLGRVVQARPAVDAGVPNRRTTENRLVPSAGSWTSPGDLQDPLVGCCASGNPVL